MPQVNSFLEVMDGLAASSRELMERMLAAVDGAGGNGQWVRQAEQAYQDGLQNLEQVVQQNLRMQQDWLRTYRSALRELPMGQLADSSLELAANSLERRGEMWGLWFSSARQLRFEPAEQLLAHWRPNSALLDSWRAWMRQMADQQRLQWAGQAGSRAEEEQAKPVAEAAVVEEPAEAAAKPRGPRAQIARSAAASA